jgi:hypothetical protein
MKIQNPFRKPVAVQAFHRKNAWQTFVKTDDGITRDQVSLSDATDFDQRIDGWDSFKTKHDENDFSKNSREGLYRWLKHYCYNVINREIIEGNVWRPEVETVKKTESIHEFLRCFIKDSFLVEVLTIIISFLILLPLGIIAGLFAFMAILVILFFPVYILDFYECHIIISVISLFSYWGVLFFLGDKWLDKA